MKREQGRSLEDPCHPEGGVRVGTRGIRNLCLLFLFPLLVVPACEDLPAAPNIPPTASFIFNPVSPITAGETPVSFNAVGSRDSDGTIASYIWSFGDGIEQSDHRAHDHPRLRRHPRPLHRDHLHRAADGHRRQGRPGHRQSDGQGHRSPRPRLLAVPLSAN